MMLYHKNSNIREKVRQNLIKLVDKVMTSTYGDDIKMESNCCQNNIPNIRTKKRYARVCYYKTLEICATKNWHNNIREECHNVRNATVESVLEILYRNM